MLPGDTPQELVAKLNQFIVRQEAAKKAVAVALRNRQRRMSLLEGEIREEIHPQNIIMKGPTGVGKTEIARRLAKIVNVPFIKVEATKYTEVGYVGRDVESMIRDLLTESLKIVKKEYETQFRKKAEQDAEDNLAKILSTYTDIKNMNDVIGSNEEYSIYNFIIKKLRSGAFDNREIEIEYTSRKQSDMQVITMPGMEELENQMHSFVENFVPRRKKRKKLTVKEARKVLIEEELEKVLNHEKIQEEAIRRTENNGIIFIDEIDKIASRENASGANISREGVQRDILPIIEGSTVKTKYGTIRTNHILFIAAGAFHIASISDLIPELQGRFPIRVELSSLKKEDYTDILQKPQNAISKQYEALLSTEKIKLKFVSSGYERIAEITHDLNTRIENIGARRLYALVEKVLEEVSFHPEKYTNKEVVVDKEFVDKNLENIITDEDMSKYIL